MKVSLFTKNHDVPILSFLFLLILMQGVLGATTALAADPIVPADVHASVTGKITCLNMVVDLSASSSTPGVLYSWSGPNGFITSPSTSSAGSTGVPGLYTVTVSDPVSGGVATDTVSVLFAQDLPQDVAANPSLAMLNCTNPVQTLTGSSSTADVSYSWTGPNGYTATGPTAVATTAGLYELQIVDNASGCISSTAATIVSDFTVPANVTAVNNGPLTCTRRQVTLTGSSTTENVDFNWSGPGNFSFPSSLAFVSKPGTYTLTTVHTVSGCTGTPFTMVVEQDLTACQAMARKLAGGTAATLNTTTGSGSGEVRTGTGFRYSVYPNPLSNASSVRFTAPASARVQVVLYNSSGVREKVLFDGRAAANQDYQFPIDASNMAIGTHFCVIRVNDKVFSSKLLMTGRP